MVQRKASNKFGVEDDLKPFSQYQGGRNRGGGGGGTELKKKMKKSSRPMMMKRPDFENLRSSRLPPPPKVKKPGPQDVPIQQKHSVPTDVAATPPQKQFSVKPSDGSPNYMKPTSSSDARKDGSNRSTLNRRDSINAKSERASSTRASSSLRRVRNLTKTPSFKPVRASTKKCSRAVLCEDFNARRATCSSTLKESKFPPRLMVYPEGSSVLKVCPYTFCSLNGHHHQGPLPPLKSFVSARRRLLKTQKSVNLKFDEKPVPTGEEDSGFFVEIYAVERRGTDKTIGDTGDGEIIDFAGEVEDLDYAVSSVEEITAAEQGEWKISESVSSGSSHYEEIDPEEAVNHSCDITFTSKEIAEESPAGEDQKVETTDEDFPGCILNGSERASEVTGMDCEGEQFHNNLDSDGGYVSEIENLDLAYEPILKVDDMVTRPFENVPMEILGECFEEEMDEATKKHDSIGNMIASDGNPVEIAAKEGDEASEVEIETQHIEPQPSREAYRDDQQRNQSLQDDGANAMLKRGIDENNSESNKLIEAHPIDAVNDGSKICRCFADESLLAEAQDDLPANNAEGSELSDTCNKLKVRNIHGRLIAEEEELRKFNPRGPNFLPVEANPEAEKVDLRHQKMDERKNSEEWMLDHALQRTVTKLAPARKRKVALLVEAFESVMPCETHLRHHPPAVLSHSRPMQACG